MKRFTSALIALILAFTIAAPVNAAGGSEYFTDIPSGAWYARYIDICYESGLLSGIGDDRFDPSGTVTIGQALMVCARIHSVLTGGSGQIPELPPEESGAHWAESAFYYLDQVVLGLPNEDKELLYAFGNAMEALYPELETLYEIEAVFDELCPRAWLAGFLYIAIPLEHLTAINDVGTLPELDCELVRTLYKAGIIGGVDDKGTLDGIGNLTRAQLAAIVARVVEPTLRLGYTAPSFAFDILAHMPRDENYMLSPISLKLALAMAANGAGGETRQEILDVLSISYLKQFNESTKAFIDTMNGNEDVQFNIANSIWLNSDFYGDKTVGFSADYTAAVEDYYDGVSQTIANASGAQTVNDWIAERTKGKINNVINDDMVKETLAFLVNTIYFKGDWARPFEASATRDGKFTDRNGTESVTAFMNDTSSYDYYADDRLRILAKPYKDSDIRMYFILPEKGAAITGAMFDEAVSGMSPEHVRFSVPKFKTEYLHDNLIEIMQALGVNAAFDGARADFSDMFAGIPQADNPVISSILQKTFIEVDEKGTEAAAATVIGIAPTSAMEPEYIEFICDRPFTYIIRDDSSGTILFIGEYAFVK